MEEFDSCVLVDSKDNSLEVDKLDKNTTKGDESTSGGDSTVDSQQDFEDEENREESI